LSVKKVEGIVSDSVRHVSGFVNQFPLSDHRRVVVITTTTLMYIPVGIAILHQLTVAQMPLS
jgi:hypothetical protein